MNVTESDLLRFAIEDAQEPRIDGDWSGLKPWPAKCPVPACPKCGRVGVCNVVQCAPRPGPSLACSTLYNPSWLADSECVHCGAVGVDGCCKKDRERLARKAKETR